MKKEVYFGEEGYGVWMKDTVKPYIGRYQKKGVLKGEDGVSIHYVTYQKPEAESCIVISHGFSEFSEKYNEVVYYFLKAGYSVYLPEHRGHGYSERETGDTDKVHVTDFENYVRDFNHFIKEVVEGREPQRILYGHSMGGAIVIRYLSQYPDTCQGAVLSSPMLQMKIGKCPQWLAKCIADCFTAAGMGSRYALGQKGFDGRPDFSNSSCVSEERYKYILHMRVEDTQYQTCGASYSWVRSAIKVTRILKKKRNLDNIKVPILLFLAGKDNMVDNRAVTAFADKTDAVSLVRMETSRHEIYNGDFETRVSYYEKMFAFFSQLETVEKDKMEEA